MKLIFISFLVIFITKIYCKLSEYHPDQIALLILSSGSWNNPYEETDVIGNIVTDKNGDPLTINIKADGESEEYASIVDIIPSLRNLEPDELKKRFSKLYKLAFATFYNIFEIEREDDIILDVDSIKQTISSYNFVNALINPEDNSNLLHERKYQSYLYTSLDTDKDNSLKEFIKSFEYENISNIDINQFADLPDDIKGIWKDDESIPELYKVIGMQCAKIEDCKNQFQYEDEQSLNDISFNIVRYTYDDGNTSNYAFIVINDKTENVYHAFTLKSDGNEKFTLNENDSTYNSVTYEYINDYYVMNSENIKKRKENEIVVEKGIGLLAESGLIYEDDQYLYEPDYYGYQNDDTDLDDEELKKEINELNEKISQMYDIKEDEGTYNSNVITNIFNFNLVSVNPVEDTENNKISFVKSKSQDDNILCSYTNDQLAHIEKLALRFLEARKYYLTNLSNDNENINGSSISKRDDPSSFKNIELLPYSELFIIDKLYEIIALKKLIIYNGSILHNKINFDFINHYEEYITTQNNLFKIDTNISKCNNDNECSINIPIFIDFDIESLFNKFMNYENDNINLVKRQNEFLRRAIIRSTLQNPSIIDSNFKSVTDAVLNQLSFYESNIRNLNMDESKNSINTLHTMIEGIKTAYAIEEQKFNPNLQYITEKEIVYLEALYEKARTMHNENFRNIEDFYIRRSIDEFDFLKQPNSKYTDDKLNDLLSAANELINFNNPYDDGTQTRMKFDENGKIINIEDTIENLKELEISDNLKEHYKPYIISLCNVAVDLERVFDRANLGREFDDYRENSRLVYGLKDAFHEFAQRNYPNDREINELANNHLEIKNGNNGEKYNSGIFEEDKTTLHYLDISRISENDIFSDPRVSKYTNQYFDRFKSDVKNDLYRNNGELSANMRNNIEELRNNIVETIERFESLNDEQNNNNGNIEGHIEEAIHIPALMNGFNEVISVLNEYQVSANDIRGLYLEDHPILETNLNYIGLELQYKAIDQVIKENSTMFKLPNGIESFKDYVYSRSTDTYSEKINNDVETFRGNTANYFELSDIYSILDGNEESNRILEMKNRNEFESTSDITRELFNLLNSDDHKIQLERYGELQYHILNNNPTIKRNEENINNMMSSRLLNGNYIRNSINPTESSEASYKRVKEDTIYNFNMFEYNRYLTDNGFNNNQRETMLNNIRSSDDIINTIDNSDIRFDDDNLRIISLNNGRYKFIRPNDMADINGVPDGVTDINIFTTMSDNLALFGDGSRYCENSENGIRSIENKNKIEVRNNSDRLAGGIFTALTKINDVFHTSCYGVTRERDLEFEAHRTKANSINESNRNNGNINENFLNRVDCTEKIGGKSFIRFDNAEEIKRYGNSFTATGNVDPYRPPKNPNSGGGNHNPNNGNHNPNNGNHNPNNGNHNPVIGGGGGHHHQ